MRISQYIPALILFTGCLSANHANAQQQQVPTVEITPFASYRFGGDFEQPNNKQTIDLDEGNGFGVITAWKYDATRQGELLFSQYNTAFNTDVTNKLYQQGISIRYLHLGGNIQLNDGLVPLWLSGGAGITHLSPDNGRLDDETNFSANLGLNTKIPITNRSHLYFGVRVYGTFLDAESEIFCDNKECEISVESDIWLQSELMAGMSFAF